MCPPLLESDQTQAQSFNVWSFMIQTKHMIHKIFGYMLMFYLCTKLNTLCYKPLFFLWHWNLSVVYGSVGWELLMELLWYDREFWNLSQEDDAAWMSECLHNLPVLLCLFLGQQLSFLLVMEGQMQMGKYLYWQDLCSVQAALNFHNAWSEWCSLMTHQMSTSEMRNSTQFSLFTMLKQIYM